MKALLTGSRAYGTPTDKSDVDVVMLAETALEYDALCLLLPPDKVPPEEEEDTLEYNSVPIRLENLNIILIGDKELYNIWEEGTKLLMEYSPVPRDVAITILKGLREGFHVLETAEIILRRWRLSNPVPEPEPQAESEIPKPPARIQRKRVGGPFWITTTSRSYCIEAESEEAALEWAEENKIGKETVMDCQCLPYPALPRLGKKSICPAFCDHPTSCAGHSSCPRNYACSE